MLLYFNYLKVDSTSVDNMGGYTTTSSRALNVAPIGFTCYNAVSGFSSTREQRLPYWDYRSAQQHADWYTGAISFGNTLYSRPAVLKTAANGYQVSVADDGAYESVGTVFPLTIVTKHGFLGEDGSVLIYTPDPNFFYRREDFVTTTNLYVSGSSGRFKNYYTEHTITAYRLSFGTANGETNLGCSGDFSRIELPAALTPVRDQLISAYPAA